MANTRVTQLNECTGLADTDMFMIDCETNGTRRVSADKIKSYIGTAKDGESIYVSHVSESTADGGSNIVTFSDGKSVTIKNGSKGSTGNAGPQGPKGDKGVWTIT